MQVRDLDDAQPAQAGGPPEAAEGAPDPAELTRLAAAYGIEIVGPPLRP